MATTMTDVFESFEASFQDKCVISKSLELMWLKKAIARYSIELDPLPYSIVAVENPSEEDELTETLVFNTTLGQYVIDTLAHFMKQMYQEREVSKVNKRINITSKDVSIAAGGYDKTAARNELLYDEAKSAWMKNNQMPTAYN